MGLRIFYVLLVIAIAWFGFQVYRLQAAYSVLDNGPEGFITAPADADLTVVEFMSYSCKFCREVHPTITEAVKKDGRVYYIPRPLPSDTDKFATHAANIAYTAGEQGRFLAAHDFLIENYRMDTMDAMLELIKKADIEETKFKADYDTQNSEQYVNQNARAFVTFGAKKTPLFIIGDNLFYTPEERMPTVDDFLKMFAQAREADQ